VAFFLHILEGSDPQLVGEKWGELLNGKAGREDLDCETDEGRSLLSAVSCPSLFGGPRVLAVDNIDKLSEAGAAALVAMAETSDAYVVARCSKMPAKTAKILTKVAQMHRCSIARNGAGARVGELAKKHGITLGSDSMALLLRVGSEKLERVDDVLFQLAMLDVVKPTIRQVTVLLGTTSGAGVPWSVTDALDAGDLARALREDHGSPFAVFSYLFNEVQRAGIVMEAGCSTPSEVEKLLDCTPFVARKALALSKKLGPQGVRDAVAALSQAERDAKSSIGEDLALDLLLVNISRLW
jgi:hypothetical protein